MMQGGVDMSFDPADYYDPRYDEYNDDVRNLRAYNVDVEKLKTSIGLMNVDQLFQVALAFVATIAGARLQKSLLEWLGTSIRNWYCARSFWRIICDESPGV